MISFGLVSLLLLLILFAGLPVAFSLGTTSIILIAMYELPMKIIANTIFTSLDSFVVIAIPLFVLMSQILLDGRVGDELFEVMNAWVRHLLGRISGWGWGLGYAGGLACLVVALVALIQPGAPCGRAGAISAASMRSSSIRASTRRRHRSWRCPYFYHR